MRVQSKVVKPTQPEHVRFQVGWAQMLIAVGLMAMLVGAMDPLEGAILILPGVALIAFATLLSKSRFRLFAFWSFVLTATGVAAMAALSSLGGVGPNSGLSMWWLALLIPYPIGAVCGFIAGVMALVESPINGGDSPQNRH